MVSEKELPRFLLISVNNKIVILKSFRLILEDLKFKRKEVLTIILSNSMRFDISFVNFDIKLEKSSILQILFKRLPVCY